MAARTGSIVGIIGATGVAGVAGVTGVAGVAGVAVIAWRDTAPDCGEFHTPKLSNPLPGCPNPPFIEAHWVVLIPY